METNRSSNQKLFHIAPIRMRAEKKTNKMSIRDEKNEILTKENHEKM